MKKGRVRKIAFTTTITGEELQKLASQVKKTDLIYVGREDDIYGHFNQGIEKMVTRTYGFNDEDDCTYKCLILK